jgi:hypothetical protein
VIGTVGSFTFTLLWVAVVLRLFKKQSFGFRLVSAIPFFGVIVIYSYIPCRFRRTSFGWLCFNLLFVSVSMFVTVGLTARVIGLFLSCAGLLCYSNSKAPPKGPIR